MLRRRQLTRLLGAGAAASAVPGIIRPAYAADPLKVGFIYLGPVGDFGWTYQHDAARKKAVEHFGDKIKTTFVENVAEGPDSEKVLNDLANSGHKLIFATSFGYMNYVLNSAKKHPKAVFYEHATGYKRAANVSDVQYSLLPGAICAGRSLPANSVKRALPVTSVRSRCRKSSRVSTRSCWACSSINPKGA